MKDLIQTVIVLVLVILAAIFVTTTKGSDPFNPNINFNIDTEEKFSYEIVNSAHNGEYRRNTGDNRYALVGLNEDGTYRVYFIFLTGSVKNVVLRLDNLKVDGNGKGKFKNASGTPLVLTLGQSSFRVDADDVSLGDSSLQGDYIFQKAISRFSMDEFTIFKYNTK